jgi:DNA-binding HxlR family transcriptional regulator
LQLQPQYIKGQEEEENEESDSNYEGMILLQVRFIKCPIKISLGVLGKKWTILIIRDIGFLKINRFDRLIESIPVIMPLLD